MKHPMLAMAKIGIVALASILPVGCSAATGPTVVQANSPTSSAHSAPPSGTPAGAPVVTHGVERDRADVPWPQVGPGWTLAMWSPVTPRRPGEQPAPGEPSSDTADTTLFLVDPRTGDRYPITTFTPDEHDPRLVDWSGDGGYALFTQGADAISVDLHTGERTVVPVHGTPAYTRPGGKALRVSTSFNGDEPGTLMRISLSGNEQLRYATGDLGGAGQFSGDYLESPDGTQLVLGTANLGNEIVPRSDNSLVVMSNDGSIIRTLPVPVPKAYCAPVKWWKPMVVLAHCTAEGSAAEQLWTIPLDGSAATALTALNAHDDQPGFEGNYGNWNAYEVPSGIFLPTAGACGTSFVSRLTPDGHTSRVDIPGLGDSTDLAGVSGDKLLVVGQTGCGGGTSLVTYDPVANTSTVLLGPPINGGGVTGGRVFPADGFPR
ncbi:MAG: hypothetical protein HYZ39_02580 [Mycolicibacterium cosmeticum]|nr:hypothetical protein [Mycolicibacterium cosmeticum]